MARGRHDYEKKVIAVESEGYRDLHGRILMNDDFEDTPFKWTGNGIGPHFETRQARATYNGSYGAELDILSDIPPTSRYAGMFRYVPIDVTERLEFVIFWRANNLDYLEYFDIWIEFYDGARYHRVVVSYNQAMALWGYLNDAGGTTILPGSGQTFRDHGWNELTLSADFATDEYIRMKSNNMEINMGGIPCRNTGNLAGAHARVWIVASNTTANQLLVSIDDAVLKELEN